MLMLNLKLCVWQPQVKAVTVGISERIAALDSAAKAASTAQAQLLITPEMYATGYNIGAARITELAEPLQGSILTQAADIAKQYAIALLIGFPELAENGQIYNSAAFIDEQGVLLNVYRKTHLYGEVDRAQFSAGQSLGEPFKFQGWVLASAICYDIEFPEVARHYAQAGVDLLLVPTANMAPFDSVATRLVPARAEENGLYVAYASYCGAEAEFNYCGLSCLCGPDGEDVARADRGNKLIYGVVSQPLLQSTRQLSPYLQGVRPDLYTTPAGN